MLLLLSGILSQLVQAAWQKELTISMQTILEVLAVHLGGKPLHILVEAIQAVETSSPIVVKNY
jgi:hypothetical protein